VQVIQGNRARLSYENLQPLNDSAQKEQTIEGLLTGGNMSLIQSSLSTPWHIQTNSRILFFEDINEAPYRIAERLEHLKQAGVFKEAQAILFGDLTHQDTAVNNPDLTEFVLKDFAQKLDIPCFQNLPVGHQEFCMPLIINAAATLKTGSMGTLRQDLREHDTR